MTISEQSILQQLFPFEYIYIYIHSLETLTIGEAFPEWTEGRSAAKSRRWVGQCVDVVHVGPLPPRDLATGPLWFLLFSLSLFLSHPARPSSSPHSRPNLPFFLLLLNFLSFSLSFLLLLILILPFLSSFLSFSL